MSYTPGVTRITQSYLDCLDMPARKPQSPPVLGTLLDTEAKKRGLTHTEAARQFGVRQQTFSRWCSGGSRPSTHLRPRLARWLGLSYADYDRAWKAAAKPRDPRAGERLDVLEERLDMLAAEVRTLRDLLAEAIRR